MKKQIVIAASFVSLAAGATMQADKARVVGIIAGVEGATAPTIQLSSKAAGTQTVRTDEKTAYTKWITNKPWGADTRMAATGLVTGRCVEVELRADNSGVAKTVRVSEEPAGSMFDPCKGLR